jgi:hypothetical protein
MRDTHHFRDSKDVRSCMPGNGANTKYIFHNITQKDANSERKEPAVSKLTNSILTTRTEQESGAVRRTLPEEHATDNKAQPRQSQLAACWNPKSGPFAPLLLPPNAEW